QAATESGVRVARISDACFYRGLEFRYVDVWTGNWTFLGTSGFQKSKVYVTANSVKDSDIVTGVTFPSRVDGQSFTLADLVGKPLFLNLTYIAGANATVAEVIDSPTIRLSAQAKRTASDSCYAALLNSFWSDLVIDHCRNVGNGKWGGSQIAFQSPNHPCVMP